MNPCWFFRDDAAAELFDFRQETQAVELANDRQEMNASVIVHVPDILPFLFHIRNDVQTTIYHWTTSTKNCREKGSDLIKQQFHLWVSLPPIRPLSANAWWRFNHYGRGLSHSLVIIIGPEVAKGCD